jgi:lipopolysaccharide export system permease protein
MVASLLATAVQEVVAPRASQWIENFHLELSDPIRHRRNQSDVLRRFHYYNRTTQRQWAVPHFRKSQPQKLKRLRVTIERSDGTKERLLTADKAEWLDGQWWFYNMAEHFYDESGQLDTSRTKYASQPTEMRQLTETPHDFMMQVRADQWETFSSLELLQYIRLRPDMASDELAIRLVHFHSRLAMPWTCLIVVLLGIPTGARTGRQGAFAGVIMAVAMFFGFYVLTYLGQFLGKKQLLWPWLSSWLPNIVFLLAGARMLGSMR